MAIRIVQLGTARNPDEGLRIGTRQATAARCAQGRLFQARLISASIWMSWALSEPFTPKRWSLFERRYRQEMRQPAPRRIITLLAALSSRRIFPSAATVEDEARCHRSALRQLLLEHGAKLA